MVQAIHQTTQFPQLLLVFRSSILLCRVVQVLICCCGEDLGAPTVAVRSSVFGSHSFGVRLQCTGFWIFLGDDISAYWFNTGTCLCQFTEAFEKISHIFCVKVDLQWDFRVHSSSCGAHCDVVYSPFEWLYHRCHCICRDLVLFVGRLPWLRGPNVLRGCLRRDVVWWWFCSWWCLRFCLGQCEAEDWKFLLHLFPVPRGVRCVCMLNYWFSSNDDICPDNYNYSRFKLKDKCCSEKWEVYLYGDMPVVVVTGHGVQSCIKLRRSPQLQFMV